MTTATVDVLDKYPLIDLRGAAGDDETVWQGLKTGELRRLTHRIAMPARELKRLPPWERASVWALACGMSVTKAVVTARAAALLWGLGTLKVDGPIDLLLPSSNPSSGRYPAQMRVRSARINDYSDEVCDWGKLRVASPFRALRDTVAYYGEEEGLVLCDSMRRRWPAFTEDKLLGMVEASPRFRGKKALRRVIAESVDCADSPLETLARMILLEMVAQGMLSDVHPQRHITTALARAGRPATGYFVDFLLDGWLVVEVDGRIKYDGVTFGKPLDAVLRAEQNREYELRHRGFRVIRVRHEDVLRRDDGSSRLRDLVLAELRQPPSVLPDPDGLGVPVLPGP